MSEARRACVRGKGIGRVSKKGMLGALRLWGPVTIHRQLLLALIGANMLVMVLASVAFYAKQKRVLLEGIDAKLEAVATLARSVLPPDYHDRIAGPGSVAEGDFQAIVERNNRLCVELGLEYIWSLMEVDGQIVFTTSTSPDKIAANNKHAHFYEPHSNPELYADTFASMRKTFRNNRDKWGEIRAALIPYQDARGRKYLFGASVRLTEVNRHLDLLVGQSVLVGLAVLALSMVVAILVARRIARPLRRLTETIQAIAEGQSGLVAEERGTYEQVTLASHFNRLNGLLQEKIGELERTRRMLIDQRDAERRQAEEDRGVSEQRYHQLLNFAVDGVLIGTHDGIIVEANACMCQLFGLARETLIGRHIGEMPFTPESVAASPFLFEALYRGELVVSERTILRRDGSQVNVEMHSKMMPDGSLQSIYHDITQRRLAERAVLEMRRMLEEAQRMAKLGAWKYDVANKEHVWTEEVYRIYGVGRDFDVNDLDACFSHYAPECRAVIREAFKCAITVGKPYELELAFVRASGERVWVRSSARPIVENDRVIRVDGNLMDVTERRRTQELLESWSALLERRVAERTAEVEKYARQLQAQTGRLVRAEEDERRRISGVLHEDLQQILVAVRMALGGVTEAVRGTPVCEVIERVDGMLARSLRLTRSLVQEIAVPALRERDLPFAVKWVAQQMEDKFGLRVSVRCEGSIPVVDENVYVCLYRVIQEILFNVVKHAGVKEAEVELSSRSSDNLRIVVRDGGCGLAPSVLSGLGKGGGSGLFGIRERIEGLGGKMDVSSTPGKGTVICLVMPVGGAC